MANLLRLLLIVAASVQALGPALARPAIFPPPDRELRVPVEGGSIYVRVNGPLDAPRPPILLIHGGPGGTHASLLDALALSDERAVILYDQLGSGRSDRPSSRANWKVDRFVDEVEAIRVALKIDHWYVLGHSWGGTVALEYSARRPPSLAGVVLASPLISTRSWLADARMLLGQLPPAIQTKIRRCDLPKPPPASVCEPAVGEFYRAYNGREPPSPARRAYRSPDDRGFNAELYNYMWGNSEFVSTGTLRRYDGEPLLRKLDGQRTLFIVGQYDEARPATALGFAARVKGAEIGVIPGAAHGIFSDRPDETLGVLRGWLNRQDVNEAAHLSGK